ncbi:glycosyltransferase family 4 protein [Methanobacterium sp.]|uniref:glycosyltransferase family 4 protein n=1 Tax=Methanobacterium sp. TaxID=2164 RepID=UPI003C71B21E
MKILILAANEINDEDPDILKYFSDISEIDSITLPSKSIIIRFMFCIWQTLKILPKINRYDIVISMSTMNGLTLSLIQKLANRLIKPKHVILDIALFRIANRSSQFHKKLFRSLLTSVEKILCYSTIQREALIEFLNFQNKVEFIPFGVEFSRYSSSDTNEKYILCVGRAGRDYETLLKAVKDLKINVIIVTGNDPIPTSGKIENNYQNIDVLNEISHEEYEKLIANASFIVLPLEDTLYPTGQTVLLESMATGKAVIATKTAGTIDYIENGKTGFFIEPYNAGDLKEKISYLLRNPVEAQIVGKNSRKSVENNFTMANTVEHLKTILNTIEK